MKDLIIIGLIAYIVYDRYIREENISQLQKDIAYVREKTEELKQKLTG